MPSRRAKCSKYRTLIARARIAQTTRAKSPRLPAAAAGQASRGLDATRSRSSSKSNRSKKSPTTCARARRRTFSRGRRENGELSVARPEIARSRATLLYEGQGTCYRVTICSSNRRRSQSRRMLAGKREERRRVAGNIGLLKPGRGPDSAHLCAQTVNRISRTLLDGRWTWRRCPRAPFSRASAMSSLRRSHLLGLVHPELQALHRRTVLADFFAPIVRSCASGRSRQRGSDKAQASPWADCSCPERSDPDRPVADRSAFSSTCAQPLFPLHSSQGPLRVPVFPPFLVHFLDAAEPPPA